MIQLISLALQVAFVAAAAVAFVTVLLSPAQAFPAIGRQTKIAWAIFTGLSALVILWQGALNFLGIIGVVCTIFYFVDVRPKVRELTASR